VINNSPDEEGEYTPAQPLKVKVRQNHGKRGK
jgi:hypothetical protein